MPDAIKHNPWFFIVKINIYMYVGLVAQHTATAAAATGGNYRE